MSRSILDTVHEIAKDWHEVGALSDEEMHEFDVLCEKSPGSYTPAQIKRIREKTETSQNKFATRLNISRTTVARWERGQTKPSIAALKLLHTVDQKGLNALSSGRP